MQDLFPRPTAPQPPQISSTTQWSASDEAEASAANLWRILTSPERPPRDADDNPYLNSFAYRPTEDIFAAPYGHFDHRLESVGATIELDNTEIPFVHANSLTGHANERGSDPTLVSDYDTRAVDSVTTLTPMQEFMYGLNEFVVDHDVEGPVEGEETLPPLPPSPSPSHEGTGSVIMTTQTYNDGPLNQNEDRTLSNSDAQYNSEKALFDLEAAYRTDSNDDDIVDVATFLAMGHSSNCWCYDCDYETPELLDLGSTDEEDGWALCSTDVEGATPSVGSEWEWDWSRSMSEEVVEEDEMDGAGWQFAGEPGPPSASALAHGAW
jgi:hypothetical protein